MALANTNVTERHGSFLTSIVDFLVGLMENHPHTRQIEKLSRMSDEELAARGVTRQDVVRHIFRDRYYV
ncbi:hypothetical protein RGUI_1840 [Rhodovulum sp. P5]|uniref:hypothetical protein n=1 Tax=Rhodovulum sp. P5 TaxID=1564506 RepID=UPI0009C1BDBF|nr:hypothetical protein [Rhodovulum sp. P5]ARE39981.1 hypothetical protein RGUI_1840 [Rhodovulum sp. P5]